jgi:hypothetical protein
MPEPPNHRQARPRLSVGGVAKRLLYSAIVSAAILLVANWAIERVTRARQIDLDTRDSQIVYLSDDPYLRDGDHYVTNPQVRDTLIASRFRANKADAWRLFILGESFAMGTPYVHQQQAQAGEGGIASWLAADLEALYPQRSIEVINAAAGAQNSHRVRRIAEAVVKLQPDALLVAACNNEGVLPPGRVDEILHRTGGYRLLAKLAAPLLGSAERSLFTPQDPDVDAIRATFEENLRAIVDTARRHDVPVLLCTMPVNLQFAGDQVGHLFQHTRDVSYPTPAISDCAARARSQLARRDAAAAVATLRACALDLEGMRVLGMALMQLRQFDEARQVLNQYTELAPRNRCRPSLNRIIREVAASTPGVTLVDLETAAANASRGGIPGDNLFVDYCHMNWVGYAAMAEVILDTMRAHGITPQEPADERRLVSREALAQQFRLD